MSEWVTTAELLALGCPALPTNKGALARYIDRAGWHEAEGRVRKRQGRGGGYEYHRTLLPPETQRKLLASAARLQEAAKPEAREALWMRYERLPAQAKDKAAARLKSVDEVTSLREGGLDATSAVALAAKNAGISASTLWVLLRQVEGLARADWLPALAPRHVGRNSTVECHQLAYDFLKADYLRPEQPSFTACYRRLLDAATEHGWSPIPSEKTLRRRLLREVPRGARTLARGGRDAAQRMFPHQTRDRSVFTAMQAVNADGHLFDVFVRWPEGDVARPIMVAVQDLYSGMIVGFALDRTENWSAVRSAFADTIESFGIPEHVWFDNGRSFASKYLTGGMATRFRFKVRDDEPVGLLTKLGCQVHWTTPYHGQAKPIERAFRDLCEEIAKHPSCAGAYTGNKPDAKPDNYASKAVPIDAFRELVASEIARHNLRKGRRTQTAVGGSFADAFKASIASGAVVTRATSAQLRMFLMAAEGVTARKPTGEIELAKNRYWAAPLAEHIGRRLMARFDPYDLLAGITVYTLDGRLIAPAPCIEAVGFADIEAAREHARVRRTFLKRQRECLELENRLSIAEVARLMRTTEPETPPEPRVVKLAVNAPAPNLEQEISRERADESFGRAMRVIAEGEVVAFPAGKERSAES